MSPLRFADALLLALEFAILVRVIWSWVDRNPFSSHPLRRGLWQITEPLLEPIRRVVPPLGGALDLSPWIAILILNLLRQVLYRAAMG